MPEGKIMTLKEAIRKYGLMWTYIQYIQVLEQPNITEFTQF